MCGKNSKRIILRIAAALLIAGECAAADLGLELTNPAPAQYQARGRRDPFVQPQAGRLRSVLEKVDIDSLHLTGVIRNPKQTLALFVSQGGPKFGYLLRGEKLFRENFQPVLGVTGRVIDPKKVVLKQGEKEIVYQLR